MEEEKIRKLIDIINRIQITEENEQDVIQMQELIEQERYAEAARLLSKLNQEGKIRLIKKEENNEIEQEEIDEEDKEDEDKEVTEENDDYEEDEEDDEEYYSLLEDDDEDEEESSYPKEISNKQLEEIYISLLLTNPKAISMYYILYEDCFFEDKKMLNLYKSVLFTSGQEYAPQKAKDGFNFAKEGSDTYKQKKELKEKAQKEKRDFEKTYIELRKLFEIRKNYSINPIKETQDKIIDILNYELYDKMTIQEVKDAIEQITATEKFKRAILNNNITNFLLTGENNLTNGLELPFPILSSVFKGIRKGETMAYAMPSNSGKSRFTINLASYLAFIHKKKVLIISNEMSEEKMRLCLITTILNNKKIQELHKQKITKTEGELLEFKFRPDSNKNVKVDEEGFILKEDKEKQSNFAKRLLDISNEFNQTIAVTKWIDEQIKNSIYFVNITNHTNDELEKVILNYYYKEKIEYIFYDTLKTDTENIGNGEEIKRTATILSNLAQNLNIFIASSLQLSETNTLPINLNINDLAVSRTVKEVLDTLCLVKQIHTEDLSKYEYSLEEVDTKFYDLEKSKNPDVRYYACVVDKNRAGAKPKVVFRLNLAYNVWEELGYLRLKSNFKGE
ncbi:MAG: hypothetical protein HFJ55_01450 [Clostridia bacterium]|nr:hypothetical protein [Clostridia bacterium]